MKSPSNKTDYDDDLYYQVIKAALKCIMIPPVDGEITIKESGKKIISAKEMQQVKTVAAGIISNIEEKEDGAYISMLHKNCIKTKIGPLKNPAYTKTGIELKQGIGLGYAKDFLLQVEILPAAIIGD